MVDNLAYKKSILQKKQIEERKNRAKDSQQQQSSLQFINSNGIVSKQKLILIAILIVLSISSLQTANRSHWPHVRALTNYFSYFILEQQDLSIYDRGDNLDETSIELITLPDMKEHFQNLVDFVENYTVNGFADFDELSQSVDMEYYFINGSLVKQLKTFQEFKRLVLQQDIRQLLLSLRVLYFQINFGNDQVVDDFKVIFDYQVYSNSMLTLDMTTKYKQKTYEKQFKQQFILRNLQRLVAIIILILYSIQARKLYYHTEIAQQFRKNSLYWCISLILLNFVATISDKLAPTCAMLQLLPIFQNYDSSSTLTYNFNVNLRYALPFVFRIIIPVYILLNGFILYSMIMYPGEYFDDYITGFFSYFYNNFQYGIYQIFIQIKSRGNVAYLLYVILYFYMVLVGSNLIPALFCSLIYQKMAQKDLINYVQNKLQLVICPRCHHQNTNDKKYGVQININSPQSPYLKSGTKLRHLQQKQTQDQKQRQQKLVKMYIQQSQQHIKSPTLSPMLALKNKHKRAKNLISQLQVSIEEAIQFNNLDWIKQVLHKLQQAKNI